MKIVKGKCEKPVGITADECVPGLTYRATSGVHQDKLLIRVADGPAGRGGRPPLASYRNRFVELETGQLRRPMMKGQRFVFVDATVCVEEDE